MIKQQFECDNITLENGNNLAIMFLGHGSLLFDYEGRIIYVDPVSEFANYSILPKADVILVTHEHDDHYDPDLISDLSKEDTRLISNKKVKALNPKATVLEYGDVWAFDDFSVEAVEAYNTTEGRDKFHPRGRDNGYFLHFDYTTVYISGDTETIANAERYQPCDIAFLAVNQPYTMTIEQALENARLLRPRIFYPYHTTDTDMEKLREVFGNEDFELRVRDMK